MKMLGTYQKYQWLMKNRLSTWSVVGGVGRLTGGENK